MSAEASTQPNTPDNSGDDVSGDGPPSKQVDMTSVPYHRYEPHRAGLPNLKVYLRDLWDRREFAIANSQAGMRAANTQTFFGQAWMVINPLLLALVYFLMVTVLARGGGDPAERLTRITCGIFVFYYFQGAVLSGTSAVTGAGKMVINTSFPRLLLPIGAVRTGFFRFLPTVPVYLLIHLAAGRPISWVTFVIPPIFLFFITIFSVGLASFFAAAQVYFRDTAAFLPYIMRLWLYVSPIILSVEQLQSHVITRTLSPFNPLFSLIGGYSEALRNGNIPTWEIWVQAAVWAAIALVIGCFYFLSRERDFAVRL